MGGIGGWRKAVIYKVKALLLDARTRNAILDTVYNQTKMTRTYLPANLWAELSRVYFPQLCSNLRLCLRSDSQLIDFFKFLRPVQLFPGLVDQCIILSTKSSKLDIFQFSNYTESVTRLIMILHDSVVRGHVSLTPPPSPSENPTSLSENQSGEIDQSHQPPDFHSWTTSLGLAYIPAAVGKIKSLDNWHITTTTVFFKKIMRKLKKKNKI